MENTEDKKLKPVIKVYTETRMTVDRSQPMWKINVEYIPHIMAQLPQKRS